MKILKFIIIFLCIDSSVSSALSPSHDYLEFPFGIFPDIQVDSLTLQTADNINIHTWHFQPLKNRKSIALYFLHPGEGNMSYYISRASTLAKYGYDVIMLDYRGFGHSDAFHIENNQIYMDEFLIDFKSVFAYYTSHIRHISQGIIALGIGSVISQLFLLENNSLTDFVIYEGFIINPVAYASRYKSIHARSVTLPASAYHYEKSIKGIKTPMFIFGGTEDSLSINYDIQKYINARKKSRILEIYEGAHLQAMLQLTENEFGDKYMSRITEFINKIIKK